MSLSGQQHPGQKSVAWNVPAMDPDLLGLEFAATNPITTDRRVQKATYTWWNGAPGWLQNVMPWNNVNTKHPENS